MDRAALIGALQRATPASLACTAALEEGADFEVSDGTTATVDLITIYSRRAKHVAAVGLEHGGFDRALSDLSACPADAVRLGHVTDRAGQRHYQLFLTPDADDVVACLWVHHEP
ncbi:hypothetical protein [Phycicoccus duodecadis]|uniref:hypothetical protein n=1 Tax=Phycicoccus duodecadis TaxID=173053 RepID=UPI000C70FB64|nr:hypothetical protein [Phycicoccus duodecadis]